MSEEGKKQTFIESFTEILLLIRTCLTSFWFWLPILFSIYFFLQPIMFFYIHPLAIFVIPIIMSLYAIHSETKRVEERYDLEKSKKAVIPSRSIVYHALNMEERIEKGVQEYKFLLEEQQKN